MKGSSLFLPGLAPPVQIQPQQQAPHFSASTILASQFQSCRHVRQYTIRLQRQEVPGLDNELRVEFLGVKHFPSSFHGDGKALKRQIPWSEENFKNAFKSYPIRRSKRTVDVQCFSRPFDESHRPRGNYPSRVIQLLAEPPRTFHSANLDLNKARDVNALGELGQSTPPSPPDFVSPGWKGRPVPTGSSFSEHRSSRRAQESILSQRAPSPANERPGRRFEMSYVVREEALPTRGPNRIASSNFYPEENLRTIEARVESENVITEQVVLPNVFSPSRRRVPQACDEFRDPWRLKESRMASEPHKREAQSAESYRPVGEAFNDFQGATGRGIDVAQMEAQSPQSRAAKWREAVNVIEQNRNPSHKVLGGIESLQQTTDSLIVEPDRAIERKANRTRSLTAKDVLEIRQRESLSREKEGQSRPISDGGMTRYGSRDAYRDTPQGNDAICIGGSAGQAVAALQNRLQRGVTTDSRTYVKVLQTCLKQKDLLAAKQVHDCIIQNGTDKKLYVAVTLLNVYIKCGGLADARQVFDQLEKKTVVTWTKMIAGYTKSNHGQLALEIFNQMRQEGVKPNEITYLSILKACASPSAIKWGKEIHECIRQDGFESDVRVGTALLNMYSKCGHIVEARQVFENLTNRNIITWNVMISALAQHGHGHEAYRLFLQMTREGFEPDAFTLASVLNASANAGALEWVKEVHGHASKTGLESDMRVGSALVHMYAKRGSIDEARKVFDRMEKRHVVTWNVMIGGLAEHGHGHEAYRLFLKMKQEGFKPTAITYVNILNASASAGALEWVKEVHGHARKAGLESDMRVGSALVHMYAESGSIDDAQKIFDRMQKRDVLTWTVMIGGLAKHGHGHAAYRLFLEMKREAFEPNAITYVSVLNASASAGALEWVREVHGHACKAGLESDMRVGSALVHMYAKSGSIDDALKVFERMEKRDVVTWNVMIGGLAEHGQGHEAYGLFLQMRQKGCEPNAITYLSILNASASVGALEWVKEVHGHASKAGLESDMRVGNALVHMYAKSGSIDDALKVFKRMEKRDVVTWNVMIGGLAEDGHGHEAYRLFLEMNQQGFDADAFTVASILNPSASAGALEWVKEVHGHASKAGLESDMRVGNALVHMYAKSGSIDDALKVFERMEKRDLVTWNVMIGGLAEHGQGHEAYRLFLEMRQEGFEADAFTVASILNPSASVGALEWVKEVHGHASKAGLESDMRVGNALVHMYAKSGSIDDALKVFKRMEKRDVVTWNVMIGGLAEHGQGHEAYRLFLEMRQEGFEPNAITYISILNASASKGALEWVKEVHGYASKAGLESDVRVGSALVHMYAKSGSIDGAQKVFDRMQERDELTWTVMIGGLAKHGHGHEAYGLFLQMRQEGFEPNAITYISILNASASVGALEWVKEVHGHASKAGLESDVLVGTALVHMYAKSGSIDDARKVFDRMEKRHVVTWNAMIGGLAQHGCGHEALELFRKMTADLLKPDETTFVVALSACCHRGLVDDGHRLFSAMKQDYGIEPDIAHYTCMVDLLGRAGHLEEARLFIRAMPIEPDAVIWTALLGACRTYGSVELGEVAAEEVFKLEPSNASAYVLLSNIYAAAGKWENVSLVRTMMQTRGIWKEPGRSWIEVDTKIHEFVLGDTSHPEAKAIYSELNKLTEKLKAEGYIPDTRLVLHNISEEDKELALCSHSEKLAIAYGLMHIPQDEPICVWKNLRVCPDCHTATKLISKVTGRDIIARDANRFHHFKDGICSCGDYW